MSAMLDAESTLDVILYNQEVERTESIVQLVLFGRLCYVQQILNNFLICGGGFLKIKITSPKIIFDFCTTCVYVLCDITSNRRSSFFALVSPGSEV